MPIRQNYNPVCDNSTCNIIDGDGAQKRWESLLPILRQYAVKCADFWAAQVEIIPSFRHKSACQETGKTNHIKIFHNTIRPRVSPLVRKTLSQSVIICQKFPNRSKL